MSEAPTHTHEKQLDHLHSELRRAAELAGTTPLDLAIPSCPGWTAEDLWHHLGSVHRWVTDVVGSDATKRTKRSDLEIELPEADQLPRWIAEGGEALVPALRKAGDTPVWSFVGTVPATWWARRQLHETLVHNLDAVIALGQSVEIHPVLAEDCLDEYLEVNAQLLASRQKPGEGSYTVHLHATDVEDPALGEWMIRVTDGALSLSREHGKGDVAVRAPMAELLLLVTGRQRLDRIQAEVFGDPQLVDRLTELVSF